MGKQKSYFTEIHQILYDDQLLHSCTVYNFVSFPKCPYNFLFNFSFHDIVFKRKTFYFRFVSEELYVEAKLGCLRRSMTFIFSPVSSGPVKPWISAPNVLLVSPFYTVFLYLYLSWVTAYHPTAKCSEPLKWAWSEKRSGNGSLGLKLVKKNTISPW